ncbi:MAG: hypothetical protein IPK67_00015 [Planctomycetes bacterium]|nr:hypothetical protein [Planctomycetota bacterium]
MLEPEVWAGAPTIGPLTQVVPRTGEPPTEATDVRILYDDWHLYIGVRCHDREPEDRGRSRRAMRSSTTTTAWRW